MTVKIGNFTYEKDDITNAYDPSLTPLLEKYLDESPYDKSANLRLLKLYQFYPHLVNLSAVNGCLIRALMYGLPDTDFTLCSYLLSEKNLKDETVAKLVEMSNCLESGQFSKFWTLKSEIASTVNFPQNFDDAIQAFIVKVLSMTYSVISANVFKQQLNSGDVSLLIGKYADLIDVPASQNSSDSVFFVPNAYNKTVEKKHVKNITYDRLYSLIAELK